MTDTSIFLDREYRVITDAEQGNPNYLEKEQKLSIEELAKEPAFVLLGEPGMGKTESLKALEKTFSGQFVPAHDFILSDVTNLDADQLYCIDALDEARVQAGSTTLNEIRKLIFQAKLSRFCIACRIADWFKTDAEDIKYVTPTKKLKVVELLPLSEEQTSKLLTTAGVQNSDDFMDQAQQLGFADMLGNPQSLKMLAAAVKQNNQQWPTKRSDAYELASISLLQEHNNRHSQIERESLTSDESLLDTSGWLCSVLLLSNLTAISNSESSNGECFGNTVSLKSVIQDFPGEASTLSKVLKRRLFQKTGNANNYSPIHRTVAEYLATRYLAKLISGNELLAGRISTLILASPHHVVSNLRGLAGWLAALSPAIRKKVFNADPVAVIDYGDLYLLSTADKKELVTYLSGRPIFNDIEHISNQGKRYSPLACLDMQSFILDWLNKLITQQNKYQIDTKESLIFTAKKLLLAIENQDKNPAWKETLELIVRSSEIPEEIRWGALDALKQHTNNPLETYLNLLNEIFNEKIQDQDMAMTGEILYALYPHYLTPAQTLKHFSPTPSSKFNSYNHFWGNLTKITPDELLLEWMDTLEKSLITGRFKINEQAPYNYNYSEFSSLILSAIEKFGEQQQPKELLKWITWLSSTFRLTKTKYKMRLSNWKQEHPELVKAAISHWLRTKNLNWPNLIDHEIMDGSMLPEMGTFWLNQAKQLINEKHIPDCLKRSFLAFEEAIAYWKNSTKSGVTFEELNEVALLHPDLEQVFDKARRSNIEDNWDRRSWLEQKKHKLENQKEEQDHKRNLESLIEKLDSIRNGEHLQYLRRTAWIELEDRAFHNSEHTWIIQILEGHPELRDATHQGYIAVLKNLTKQDITKAEKARENNQTLLLELPAYVGAARLFKQDPTQFYLLNDETLQALSTLFIRYSNEAMTDWILDLSEKKPELMGKLWWDSYSEIFKNLKKHEEIRLPFFHSLHREPRLADLAIQLLPKTFKHWPLKVSRRDLAAFNDLLIAMIQHCPEALPELLNKRLQRKTISATQKASLIMAGMWVAPLQFIHRLEPLFKQQTIARYPYLDFIAQVYPFGSANYEAIPFPTWDLKTKALLFRLFAPLFPPYPPDVSGWVNRDDDGRSFLKKLGSQFFNNLERDNLQTIKDIRNDPKLVPWENYLDSLLNRYAKAIAEQSFTIPTPIQVAGVLQDKAPANHADLMTTTLEALEQLQIEIDNSPTDLINRFWNVDSNAQKAIPPHRPENECRNVIAAWLAAKLQHKGITLLPELLHGSGNKSDIGLLVQNKTQPDLILPIEVKGDWNTSTKNNRDLWHAAKHQLYDKYITDPSCGACGLYLVLWMGNRKKVSSHPNHNSIASASELRQALVDETKKQMGDTAKQIEIVVLDLSIT